MPVRAPSEPGEYTFAARMVHEGVELFGPTVRGAVTVAYGAGTGDGLDSGDDDDHARGTGGCATSRDVSAWALMALGILLVRRRTN